MSKTFILTAGGSGGHVFPAQALAQELINRGHKVVFITDKRGTSFSGMFPNSQEYRIHAGAYANLSKIRKLKALFNMGIGILQAIKLINKIKPAAVVGFGGYASFPTAFAAGLLHTPLILHEQNSVLGGANRVLARGAKLVATTFPEVARIPANLKTKWTGVPVRPQILELNKIEYKAPHNKLNILIFGGSQGATIFSKVIPQAFELIPESEKSKLTITQQARQADLAELNNYYDRINLKVETGSFFTDMAERLQVADIVICRAGASTIAELTTAGKPAIIVPILHSPDLHQLHNAEYMGKNDACWLIEEPDFTPEKLQELILSLLNDPSQLKEKSDNAKKLAMIDAVSRFADAVIETSK
ncbi:MAG: undecaprenyldiphospho-muramoylpentapeptide beta-N-acetylglucosaminyltransferase [Alphaproteobacteria bacterium]|nr:undecaprenyldiphospho-muramoylpentapeptide beta-N-acetylglucosaminyltransferase [Alphaproteobacteria bacterium]